MAALLAGCSVTSTSSLSFAASTFPFIQDCEDRFMLKMIMSSIKNCPSMIIGCSNVVLGSKVASYNYVSKDPADTKMPPVLPPGKGDCELVYARAFRQWRWCL